MPTSKVIVTIAGLVAIVWVLRYFLAAPVPTHRAPRTTRQP